MNIRDLLAATGGYGSIANELGLSQAEVTRGAEALLPAVLGGFKRQAQSQTFGAQDFGGLLERLGGGGLLDNVLDAAPTDVNRGNDVLGQIFGTRDVSRSVAQHAASKSGLSAQTLKKMLPMLAMLVTGYLSKRQNGFAGAAPQNGGFGGMTGSPQSAGGGLGALLDLDGDGNPLDDILGMVQRSFR